LQERVSFVPNRLAHTREHREGIGELEKVIKEEGRGLGLGQLLSSKG